MDADIKNKLLNLSDAEFLSFLYQERDREESLNTYQGWNVWAVIGAMITIVCAGYRVLYSHSNEIDWLRFGFFISCFIGFSFSYRYWFMYIMSFWKRKRGIDFCKVKYLKDIAPIPYLIVATICSVGLSIFFPLVNNENRWDIISFLWIFMAISYILLSINVFLFKDSIVHSYFDGLFFSNKKLEIWVDGSISLILCIIGYNSFRHISGKVIGSPDFEISVCMFSFLLLFYLLLKILTSEKKSSQLDVLLDEYIYKNKSKEYVYQQLRTHSMGYSILEVCSTDLMLIKQSIDDFEPQKKKVEDITEKLINKSYEVDLMNDYFDILKDALKYSDNCCQQSKSLIDKLNQIIKFVPFLEENEEFKNLYFVSNVQINRAKVISDVVTTALNEFQRCYNEFGRNKYDGLCFNKDCQHRYDKKTLSFKIKLLLKRIALSCRFLNKVFFKKRFDSLSACLYE